MCVFSRLIRVGSRCWKTQMHGQHSSNKKTNVSLLGLRLPGQWGEYNRLERSGRGGGGGACRLAALSGVHRIEFWGQMPL